MPVDAHALVGAYALDAAPDADRRTFSRHLRRCAACTTEVGEYRETLGRLGEAVGAPVVPARLRPGVLAQIEQTAQDSNRGWSARIREWLRRL